MSLPRQKGKEERGGGGGNVKYTKTLCTRACVQHIFCDEVNGSPIDPPLMVACLVTVVMHWYGGTHLYIKLERPRIDLVSFFGIPFPVLGHV